MYMMLIFKEMNSFVMFGIGSTFVHDLWQFIYHIPLTGCRKLVDITWCSSCGTSTKAVVTARQTEAPWRGQSYHPPRTSHGLFSCFPTLCQDAVLGSPARTIALCCCCRGSSLCTGSVHWIPQILWRCKYQLMWSQ